MPVFDTPDGFAEQVAAELSIQSPALRSRVRRLLEAGERVEVVTPEPGWLTTLVGGFVVAEPPGSRVPDRRELERLSERLRADAKRWAPLVGEPVDVEDDERDSRDRAERRTGKPPGPEPTPDESVSGRRLIDRLLGRERPQKGETGGR